MNIIIWSSSFDLKNHKGYLEDTWTRDECPVNLTSIQIGQVINYMFPNSNIVYVCKVIDMRIYYKALEIQVEVINILE